jgi:hypothetical protein
MRPRRERMRPVLHRAPIDVGRRPNLVP